jgi:chemotaxis signal transduction protein
MAAAPLDVMFFELRGLRCALPLSVVRRVLPMCGVTPVPLAPGIVRGIAPLGGHILPVLELDACFQAAGEAWSDAPTFRAAKDKLLLLETTPESGHESMQVALAVEHNVSVGRVDEQHSRPPPPRPVFVSATILDANGPALLLDAERTVEFVREAISAVIDS